jgi:hypothetical protein
METPEPSAAPRQTLAMRMAERSRLRAERAERLARLAPARDEGPAVSSAVSSAKTHPGTQQEEPAAPLLAVPFIGDEQDSAAALEEFLRSLTRGLGGSQPPVMRPTLPCAPPPAGEVLPFQRPPSPEGREALDEAGCDLRRLAGVGPGLAWALRRAGIPDLASVAAIEPEALAARLGSIGPLVPARAWVEAARGLGA